MQLKGKKICIITTILVYCATFILQSNLAFFQTWAKETENSRVNIVTILVDNEIYSSISGAIKWYSSYIQGRLSDTKALVIPLDVKKNSAYDIYRMMENIYFDGLENTSSSLIGLIMVGNIPFPVVNQDGYVFPTVYPYVDFENQKYVWDDESQYFVSNGNPGGQAEIWHGLINYGTDIQAYNDYFTKIQKYITEPDEFIGTGMWYEDFIAEKEGFLDENYQYYKNKMIFGEDLGYQRYSPLMKKLFSDESTDNAMDILLGLQDATGITFEGSDEESIEMLKASKNEGMHSTKMIQQEIEDSYLADYNDLFSYPSETTMRENVFAGGRWIETYRNSEGQNTLVSDSDTSASFIQMKDTLNLGSETLVGLIQNWNDLLEEMVDEKIEQEKYSMDIVVPISHEEITKTVVKFQCYPLVRRWQNYYFGQYALYIDEPIDLSIYRGTYRNLEDLSGVTYNSLENDKNNPVVSDKDKTNTKLKSIGASYDIFSAQSEGNRGYTMLSTADDLDIYESNRTVKNSRKERKGFFAKIKILSWPEVCDEESKKKKNVCEGLSEFAQRRWGGASSINLDMTGYQEQGRYILNGYKATDSWRSVYDMGGFQNLLQGVDEGDNGKGWVTGTGTGPQWAATSYKAYLKYASPTESEGWREKDVALAGYVTYTNHEPTTHTGFETMNFWQLDKQIVDGTDTGWVWTGLSNNTFYVEKVIPREKKSKCGSEENYTFKTMSSVVKHVSTTDEQINGIDYDKYGDSGSLGGYYKVIREGYESLDEDIQSITSENSGNVVELQELKNKTLSLEGQIKDKKNIAKQNIEEKERLERDENNLNREKSDLESDLSSLRSQLRSCDEEEEDCDAIERNIDLIEGEIDDLNDEIGDKENDIRHIESTINQNVQDINNLLKQVLENVQKSKEIISNVYILARSLSADPVQLALEYIIYSEGQNPDDYTGTFSEGLLQIPFLQERKNNISALQNKITDDYNEDVKIYQRAIHTLQEHKASWENIKSELKEIDSKVNIDSAAVSSAFDSLFSITNVDELGDSYSEILDDNSVTKKCENRENESCTDDFLTLFAETNNVYSNLIKDDNDGDTIVAHAKENTDFILWLVNERLEEISNQSETLDKSIKNLEASLSQESDISKRDSIGNEILSIERQSKALQSEASELLICSLKADCPSLLNSYSDPEIITLYSQRAKGDGLGEITDPVELELIQGATEHLSGLNILTADRPIDSPRYVSMQSIAENEIKLIYPDLFKVEVYKVTGQKNGYDVHELMTGAEIKESLVKYLKGKVDEYNTILQAEYDNRSKSDDYFNIVGQYDEFATPNTEVRPYGYFTYDDMLNAIGGEAALDAIADILYYQSLTNKKKLSAEGISDDLGLIKTSFGLNDKREYILENYLTLGNKKSQLVIPNYNQTGYEVAYINSNGGDYVIPSEETPSSVAEAAAEAAEFSINNKGNENGNEKTDADIQCNIPESGRLPLFQLNDKKKLTSPWLSGFNCRWNQLISGSLASVSLTFDNSLGDVVVGSGWAEFVKSLGPAALASLDETKDSLNSRKDSMQEHFDARDEILNPTIVDDARKDIAEEQVEANQNNKDNENVPNLSKISKYVKVKIDNSRLSDNNSISELKIASSSDIGNITVQIFSTGDSCLSLNDQNLCQSVFSYTFNPHSDPFTGLVKTYDHIMGTSALDVRLSGGSGGGRSSSNGVSNYIRKMLVISVDPSDLYRAEIKLEDNKTVAGMITSGSVIGYDKYGNKINWSLENYDFSVSQGRFLKNGVYVTGFTTNNFKNLKFDYQAPLDAEDNSEAIIQVCKSNTEEKSVLVQHIQRIIQGSPEVKLNGKVIMQGNQLTSKSSLTLTSDENIYKSDGSVNVAKLQKIEVKIKDARGQVINLDSQIVVTSKNGLVKVGQVNGTGFYVRSKMDIKGGEATVYYYPTTVAGDDVIYIQIPGLDRREINLSVLPASPYAVQIEVPDDMLPLGGSMTAEVMIADKYGNLVKDPVVVSFEYDEDRIESSLGPVATITNGYSKFVLKGLDAGYAYIIGSVGGAKKGYAEFTIDKTIFPTENLNIMYLNYFGNDWGNQRGYFSDNNKYVENMMMQSEKIITTTTQLVSEDKIKKMVRKIDPGFQIRNPDNLPTMLSILNGKMVVDMGGISELKLLFPSVKWVQAASLDSIENVVSKTSDNMVFFIPSREYYSFDGGVIYSGKDMITSINGGQIFSLSSSKTSNGDNVWNLTVDGEKIGSLVFHLTSLMAKTSDFTIPGDRYLIRSTFTKGSTAKMQSVGLFDSQSNFELNSNYKSIQDSDELDERVGFIGDFKNITLFGEGEIVGEATKKFGSEFVINLGDPVLSRKSNNDVVYGTDFDGGIGQEIYVDSENDISGVYEIDFNKDGLKDLLVVYLDGTLKLAKNYGGSPDLRNMQELMRLAVGITEVYIGDADGNGYDDILIRTKNNQLRTYLNDKGIFDVDGYVACLNTNVNAGEQSSKPSSLDGVYQLFVEDMDQDGKIDIITNDYHGYIKIFYGGKSSAGSNYLSTEKYACDTGWYNREIGNTETVIGLGLTISNGEKIYDNSMMRWEGLTKPNIEIKEEDMSSLGITTNTKLFEDENVAEIIGEKAGNSKDADISKAVAEAVDTFDVDKASAVFSQDLTKYQEESLLENDLVGGGGEQNYTFIPISYLDDSPLSEDKALVWKTYSSKGGVLQPGDKVTVTVTIKALKSFSHGTFGDIIQGPWNVYYDNKDVFKGIKFVQNQKNAVVLQQDGKFNYLIDNISLSAGQSLVYQYELEYANVPFTKIDITYKTFYSEDNYPDIKLQSVDGCVKNFDVFLGNGSRSHQGQGIYLEDKIAEYYSLVEGDTEDQSDVIENVGSDVNALPGIVQDKISRIKLLQSNIVIEDTDEGKSELLKIIEQTVNNAVVEQLVNDAMMEGVLDLNFDLNIFKDEIDEINSVIDDITKGMCNGFNFGGSNTCQGLPVPFNQAFLAPGKYHLFGCRDLPLGKLEKGLPVFFFPGTMPIYETIPMPDGLKAAEDGFIWVGGGNPAYASWIRIYAAPTLTNQLGLGICIGPYAVGANLTSPFSDIGGNCIVLAIQPQCKNKENLQDKDNPNEIFNQETQEVGDSGICANSIKGLQVTENGGATSPLNAEVTGGAGVVNQDDIELSDEKINEILATLDEAWNKKCSRKILKVDCTNLMSPSEARNEYLKNGGTIKGKKTLGKIKDVIGGVYFEDVKLTVADTSYSYAGGYSSSFLGVVNMEIDAVNGAEEDSVAMESSLYIGNVDILGGDFSINKIRGGLQQGIRELLIDKWLDPQIRYIAAQLTQMHIAVILPDMESLLGDWSSTNNSINNLGNIWSNVKEAYSTMSAGIDENWQSLNGVKLKDSGLMTWDNSSYDMLDDFNRSIANPFESLASLMSQNNLVNIITEPITVKIPMIFPEDINAYAIYLQQWIDINSGIIKDWESALEVWYKSCDKNSESEQEKAACYQDAKQKFDYFVEFEKNEWVRMLDQVNTNILILQKYRDFPFEIYEWIHVIDRYMSELATLISDTLGYLSYWTETNANRIVGYIDAITLIMNIIKTYQVIIDFSVNWSENCGNCTEDTYDQYSCKLSLLCDSIELPIIQIPNFKLPNITVDLSSIDLGLDIVLPEFNFQTIRFDLPDIANLPEPPSVSIDLNVFNLPEIPQLPEPPVLPDLPSFIPEVEIELPTIPPAPELPVVPNEIKSLIDVSNMVGKIYCIVKGKFGLVGESSVKAKIEQLTQRSYEVPRIDKIRDYTNWSAAEVKNYGVDYEISTHVDFQFDLAPFYDIIDAITTSINDMSTSVIDIGNEGLRMASSVTFGVSDTLDSTISTVGDVGADIINNVGNGNTLDAMGGSLKKGGQDIGDIWGDARQDIKDDGKQIGDDGKKIGNDSKDLIEQLKNSLRISYNGNTQENNSQIEFLGLTTDEVEYADYNSAKERLKEVLTYFKFAANDTTFTDRVNSSIKKIENEINSSSIINPNDEGVNEVKNQVLTYLDEKKSDYSDLAEMINNDYDGFLAMLDKQDSLGDTKSSEENEKVLAFNTNLFNIDSSTKESLQNLTKQNPYQDLLENKKTIVDGYWNAVNTNTADTLGLTQSQYLVLRNSIGNVRQNVAGLYAMVKPTQSTKLVSSDGTLMNKTLVAADGSVDLGESTTMAMTVDPSGYAQGIFERILYGADAGTNRLVKVVHSDKFTEMIGDRHYKTNQTDNHDIILRTENAVYRKCNGGECGKGSSNSSYYVSAPLLEIPHEETWLSFSNGLKLKIADEDLEVKNWSVQGQTFDNLSLSWQLGDKNDIPYLIKLVERIDYSYEKADYNNSALPRYVLALPNGMELDNDMEVEIINKTDTLKNMLGNEIVEVVHYDRNETITHVTVSNVDRKRYYARIATMKDNEGTFTINSPWSNQIVAGKQVLGDNQSPIGKGQLIRTVLGNVVSEGDELDGFVGTEYTLIVKWTDNAALSYINIMQNGVVLEEKYTIQNEDEISVGGIFHTNTNKETFTSIGIDQEGNKTEKTIQISFDIPEITITDVQKVEDPERIAITAVLSQDIDRGEVTFQRQRGEVRKSMIPMNKTGADFSLAPKMSVIVGEFSAGGGIAFYDKDDSVMALMDPDTSEIVAQSGYENKLEFNVRVDDSAIIDVYDKQKGSVLFSIAIPTLSLVKYEVSKIYTVSDLPENGKMGMYNGGKVVHRDGLNILYIAPNGHLYSDYSLEGTYSYDREQEAMKLVLHEFDKENNQIVVWLKVAPYVAQ